MEEKKNVAAKAAEFTALVGYSAYMHMHTQRLEYINYLEPSEVSKSQRRNYAKRQVKRT